MKDVRVGNIRFGKNKPTVLIAGPCVIESESSALRHARELKGITADMGIPFIYKTSYDKANRSSVTSFRGPGLKRGLKILERIKEKFGIPVLSDVHCIREVSAAKRVLDVIQIPALLCRQTDLILEVARAGKVVNLKKGQFLSPWDMRNVIRKVESAGNRRILLTERGTSFGYNNLVSDFRSLIIMKEFGYPVIYDASHSVQLPVAKGDKSGGDRRFIPTLAMAACACGANGLFVEVHEDPGKALCDGPNMMKLKDIRKILVRIKEMEKVVRDL